MAFRLLAIGDVVGESGLEFLRTHLSTLKRLYGVDFTVCNGENAAGSGINPDQADALLRAGVDVITLGNHTFARNKIISYMENCPDIIRPANYAPGNPGTGYRVTDTPFGRVCILNLIGRCGMNFGPENPLLAADVILKSVPADYYFVDMHAEATSEKLALCFYLDGRVSGVWGTHTHVQTSDATVFPKGTGYVTDLGMTGPVNSVLGVRPEQSVSVFLGKPPVRYETAPGPCKLEGAVLTVESDGRCSGVEAIRITD